jgi:hypothetical protein
MLAKPTKAITEVLDKFEGCKFTCEYKYDGERAQVCLPFFVRALFLATVRLGSYMLVRSDVQIHRQADGTITVFSRNSENMTVKYPDFVDSIPHVRLSTFLSPRLIRQPFINPTDSAPDGSILCLTGHERLRSRLHPRLRSRRVGPDRPEAAALPGAEQAEEKGR